MVFESVLADVLNRFLKPYVKKLDTSQLKLGIWGGNVSLGKLELKEDLFDELDLPLKIKNSYIGGITMKIPWKKLAKDPILVTINEVYIIVSPNIGRKYNEEIDMKQRQKEKEKQIKKIEDAAKKLNDKKKQSLKSKSKKGTSDKNPDKPDTFTEKLAAHLVKNLQVKIQDIHVRYEDAETNPSSVIAMGATLHSLELKSTDTNWMPCVVKETATLIYKLIELNCVSVYWTTYAQSLSDLPGDKWMIAMKEQIARPDVEPPAVNTYLLQPISAVLKVKLNLKPGLDMGLPQLFGSFECNDITISLMEKQFKSLMFMLDAFNRYQLNQKYLKYKPVNAVKENTREWWKYAYNAILEEDVKRRLYMWSWKRMKEHRVRCRTYTNKYYEKLTSINVSSSLTKEIEALEDQLDVFNIIMCRKIAKRKKKKQVVSANVKAVTPSPQSSITKPPSVTTPTDPPLIISTGATPFNKPQATPTEISGHAGPEKRKKVKEKKGFFSRFKKSLKHQDPTEELVPTALSVTSSGGERKVITPLKEETGDRERFFQEIGYSEDDEYTEFPREYVAHHIVVAVNCVKLELSGATKKLATIITRNVSVDVHNRPSSKSVSVSASIGSIDVTGVSHDSYETMMVTADDRGVVKGTDPLVNFQLELNPLDRENMDLIVKTNVRPLKVIYNEETIDGLITSFRIRKNIHLQELTSAASSSIEQLKSQTSVGLQGALQNRKQLEVDINVHSPYIIIPEKGNYSEDHHVLVIDLGRLSISGNTKDPKTLYKEISSRQTFSVYYDTFTIQLKDLQVLIAKPDDDWQTAKLTGSTPLHIMDKTGFSIELKKSIVSDDALLPSLQINGDIPGFTIDINDDKLKSVLKIISTLKLPPPSLKNTTTYYNELPPPPTVTSNRDIDDVPNELFRTVSVDTMSIASYDEDDEDMDEVVSITGSPPPDEDDDESTSKFVFTDVKIKLIIRKIQVSLSQLGRDGKQQPLLLVGVNGMVADVNDRSWDLQGCVSVDDISILDYITQDLFGKPTYLLKTKSLTDGKFLSARFVSITQVGKEFASKYTGLDNSASVQMSLIQITLQQNTVAALIQFALSLKPALAAIPQDSSVSPESSLLTGVPNEFTQLSNEVELTTPPKEMHIEASFEGIDFIVSSIDSPVIHSSVIGFSVVVDLKAKEKIIVASIEDVVVENPLPDANVTHIVRKLEKNKDMIKLELHIYPDATKGSNKQDLEKIDASISAEIQRIKAHLDTGFLGNVLGFVQKLKLDSEAIVAAYNATAGTATATASALKDSTSSSFRAQLKISLVAPLIIIPYSNMNNSGTLHIDLGNFTVSNRFIHGYQVYDTRGSVMSLDTSQAILDRIEITCTSLRIFRESQNGSGPHGIMVRSDILDDLQFVAVITRNLTTEQTHLFPDVKIRLEIEDNIKFHLSDEDIQALFTIVLTVTKVRDVMAPSQKPIVSRPRAPTKPHPPKPHLVTKSTPAIRLATFDPEQVIKLSLEVELKSVSLELTKEDHTLLMGVTSDLMANVKLSKKTVSIKTRVGKLGIIDEDESLNLKHRNILSFVENKSKAVSIEVNVPLDNAEKEGINPLASIDVTIAQLQLYVPPSFIKRILDFVLSLNLNPQLIKSATKVAQDGASVATELVQDVFVKLNISLHAPMILLPNTGDMAIMIDLGKLSLTNEINSLQKDLVIDCFAVALQDFKVSRVLIKSVEIKKYDKEEEMISITSERIMIQPYSMLVNFQRNLCPWNTSLPLFDLDIKMGIFKIFLGQEDLEIIAKFSLEMVELLVPILAKKGKKQIEIAGAVVEGLKDTDSEKTKELEEEEDKYKKISASVSLNEFQLQLFRNEPKLSSESPGCQELSLQYGLASFQLVSAEIKAGIISNDDISLTAIVSDMALIDQQEERQRRKTGNRVLQHFTSNPLEAYTGKISKPIFKVEYFQQSKEHSVLIDAGNILLLSDLGFIQSIVEYFKNVFSDIKPPQLNKDEETVSTAVSVPSSPEKDSKESSKPLNIPYIKIDAHIKDVRIAVIETEEATEPQALIMKISAYCHLRVDPNNNTKQVSFNIADLGVTTCSFFDLDTATSAVLLPTSMFFTASGPLDNILAIDINGNIQTMSLKLSPPIVRLILHAIKTLLLSAEKPRPPPAPADLWKNKSLIGSSLWYLLPVPLHSDNTIQQLNRSKEDKEEILTISLEGFELILETEATERSSAIPVLSINANSVIQAFDWTGKLRVTAEAQCEASYFNPQLSVWEPLLEPLVLENESLKPWSVHAEVTRNIASSPSSMSVESSEALTPEPDFVISATATDPVQLTITKTSIQIIKDLAESCTKEYGKKVEGKVNIKSLTGAPFTVVNKLGPNTDLFVQPRMSVKLLEGKQFCKLSYNQSIDLIHLKNKGHLSYASIINQSIKDEHSIDLSIGRVYHNLTNVTIDIPGSYYYQLLAKEESLAPKTGIVVEVSVTGAKKTIIVRSPVQVKNHLTIPVELLASLPMSQPVVQCDILPGDVYSVPFGVVFTAELSLQPKDFGLQPCVPPFMWQTLKPDQDQINTTCILPGDLTTAFHIKVLVEEESYKKHNTLPDGICAHHIFHIHPPAIIQNLLPFDMTVEAEDGSLHSFTLKPGDTQELYNINLPYPPALFITVPEEEMCGRINLPPDLPEEITFIIGKGHSKVVLSILHEDLGYHRLSVYCPFWMINKTGLHLEYKDDRSGNVFKHPPNKKILLLSCEDKKQCKIHLLNRTKRGSRTEWSRAFSLQAVGTSGRVSSKLSETCTYQFGVGVQLAKFTLSKLVVITPYYLLVNQTNIDLHVLEETGEGVIIPKGGLLIPFWPLTDTNQILLRIENEDSVLFNYKTSDSIVLKLKTEPTALCVEVQETGSTNVITISSYFEGCTPVRIINLFPNLTLMFRQDVNRESLPWYFVKSGETIMYTWDDPSANRSLKWGLKGTKVSKSLDVTKDGQGSFNIDVESGSTMSSLGPSRFGGTGHFPSLTSPSSSNEMWLSVESKERLSESLVSIEDRGRRIPHTHNKPITRGHWKSFIDELQRVVVFTNEEGVIDHIKAADSVAKNMIGISLSIRSIGLSLVDNNRKREVAYIGVTQSGVIWQVARKRGHWKTLNNTVIALLEEAYLKKQKDLRHKDLCVNLESMKMFTPLKGALRRTRYEGVELRAGVSKKDFSVQAKIGYVQIDNQLPFSVYPQMLYPLPPPPTVASTLEPKPFVEASIIIRRTDQPNVNHFKYVHVLVQKMAVNVDLGFVLSLLDLFSLSDSSSLLEAQYVENDIEFAGQTLQKIILPTTADEAVKRNFFDVLHLSPIKITLSFNVRSVGRHKLDKEQSVGDRFLQLFLHSLGVILTSVQEAEMSFSLFHLEYIAVTWSKLIDLFIKHYRTQGLVQIHTIILGLDVLGNPVNIVRGVVAGTFDLFYEPIKGSVLGPEEFADGLGIGLKSFFGGTVGGLTGAGARITGAFGDVFAKLTFDDDFIDRRQQEKVKSNKLGSKFGGFFKNIAEGVTGVVVQPIKGIKEEGAFGLLKGTGRGLVGLLVRPAGGLIDLTSGTLQFVTRQTKVGDVDIIQIRPPRFIGKDGIVTPYYPNKAIGFALLNETDEGKYTDKDFYLDHIQISDKPNFLIVTDKRYLVIEQKTLTDGWKSTQKLHFRHFTYEAIRGDNNVYITTDQAARASKASQISLSSESLAEEVKEIVNKGYKIYKEFK